MRGFPKHINSKQDIENLKTQYPNEIKAYLQAQFADRLKWITVKKLDEKDTGITTKDAEALAVDAKDGKIDTKEIIISKVTEIKGDNGAITERYQEEYKEDLNCHLFKIGMTIAEVQALVK